MVQVMHVLLCLLWLIATSNGELELLITLARHGSRAPNKVVMNICPRNRNNLASYNVPLQQLTEYGMNQLKELGSHIRDVYFEEKKFLHSSLGAGNTTSFETYFRADSALRCSQSATSMALGLYPDGTGPGNFPQQPVSVFMQLLKNEVDFAAPKCICKTVRDKDLDNYAKTRALELFDQNKDLLRHLGDICGVNYEEYPSVEGGEDIVLGIKDIADSFEFDKEQGLPIMNRLTAQFREQIRSLAFQMLMERYYDTQRKITYWAGGFPLLIMNNIKQSLQHKKYKYFSYHGHRELLHAMGMMLGWKFNFPNQPRALGTTSLPPATTMFFEIHSDENISKSKLASNVDDYHVKFFIWSPETNRTEVTIKDCPMKCPLRSFFSIIEKHIQSTGTYNQICDLHHSVANQNNTTIPNASNKSKTASTSIFDKYSTKKWIIIGSIAISIIIVYAIYMCFKRQCSSKNGYTMVK